MAPYRQNLSTANAAAGTMTGANGGTQQLGAAAQRRAGLLQRANGLAVGGGAPGGAPQLSAPMPPAGPLTTFAPNTGTPETEMRSLTGGGLQAPMVNDFATKPGGETPPLGARSPYQVQDGLDAGFSPQPLGVNLPSVEMPVAPPPQLGAPMPPPQADPMGVAMPARPPAPVAGNPGMSAFQTAMQGRAAAPKPVGGKPVSRGPSTLSDVYRGGRMGKPAGDVRGGQKPPQQTFRRPVVR